MNNCGCWVILLGLIAISSPAQAALPQITQLTPGVTYTGTLPPTTLALASTPQLYSFNVPQDTYLIIVNVSQTSSAPCASIYIWEKSQIVPCIYPAFDDVCYAALSSSSTFLTDTIKFYTFMKNYQSLINVVDVPWFLALSKGDQTDYTRSCGYNISVTVKTCGGVALVASDGYGSPICASLSPIAAGSSVLSGPNGVAYYIDIPEHTGSIRVTISGSQGGLFLRGHSGAPANGDKWQCYSAPGTLSGIWNHVLDCDNPKKGRFYIYVLGASFTNQLVDVSINQCPSGFGGPKCTSPSTHLNLTSPETVISMKCNSSGIAAHYFWIDSSEINGKLQFKATQVGNTGNPTAYIYFRQNGFPRFSFLSTITFNTGINTIDTDTYQRPISSSFSIGEETLYLPSRLYFAVTCETLSLNLAFNYTVSWKVNPPQSTTGTTALQTTGTTAAITTGTTAAITTGTTAAQTTGTTDAQTTGTTAAAVTSTTSVSVVSSSSALHLFWTLLFNSLLFSLLILIN